MSIEKIDGNFKVVSKLPKTDIVFKSVLENPFKIYGVFYENGCFRRIPQELAERVNKGVAFLNTNTAGGRVKFKTDSKYIAINTKMHSIAKMSHFSFSGSIGFDMYADFGTGMQFCKTFVPPSDISDGYEGIVEFENENIKEITLNLPLYSGVKELYIGVSENSVLESPSEYITDKPIVYYGSSITQGACASRPGNAYEALISLKNNYDFVNLGFSGSAFGEALIAEYISGLSMSAFVYDYDHNSPTVEHLEKTHEPMFKIIRENNPDLPIIMLTSFSNNFFLKDADKRRKIIYKTYSKAKKHGDKNVYFIDGTRFFKECENSATVEGTHPNDIGFYYMARLIGKQLDKIL